MLGPTMNKATGELALIDRIRSGSKGAGTAEHKGGLGRGVLLGIGDDCAILRPPKGHELLVTTDFTLEGRHFRRGWHPPESVGHRALARGLSDLAAMGARPMAAFLSLALPAEMLATRQGRAWVERFFKGMWELGAEYRVSLAGGDTAESPCGLVLADIVLVGSAPAGRALRRSGGRAGDALVCDRETGWSGRGVGGDGAAETATHPSKRYFEGRAIQIERTPADVSSSAHRGWAGFGAAQAGDSCDRLERWAVDRFDAPMSRVRRRCGHLRWCAADASADGENWIG